MLSHETLHPETGDPSTFRIPVLLRILSLVCAFATGCGGSDLLQVTGKITVDGTPAEGALLMFFPESSTTASVATAVASSDGTFSLVSDKSAGVATGRYQVTVSWPDPSKKLTERDMMMGNFDGGPDLLKGRYVSKDTSGLTAEITASTKELPPFELSTK